jgi:hypothetical protein
MAKRVELSKSTSNYDDIQKERVSAFMKSFQSNNSKIEEVFLSERVYQTIKEEKLLLPSYEVTKILSFLPLKMNIYVSICPQCVDDSRLKSFQTLVERGAIIPALTSAYSFYPPAVQNIIMSHDHISSFEFEAYKFATLMEDVDRAVCSHCARLKRDQIAKTMSQSKLLRPIMSDLDQVMGNIYPFIYPDFELISVLEKITKRGNKVQFRKLMGISYVINKVRSAEAFNAQIVIDESDIEGIPEGFRKSTDKALQVRAHLNKAISDGLGLTIPVDIGLEKYIELARDFQPQIAKIVGNVVKNSNAVNRTSAASAMHKEIMKINGEIERIKGLKRHMLLESAAEFYSNNRALASTAFIAGGLGLGPDRLLGWSGSGDC